LCGHKSDAKKNPERKVYKAFNELGWEHVKIILIEEHFLENRDQQLREESRVIQMHIHDEKCLNSIRPWVSQEEERVRHKKYYEENK